MKPAIPAAAILLLTILAGCDNTYQPRQISKDRASSGIPPLTGTLPNGVIGDSSTK